MLVQRLSMPQWHRLLGQSILMLQTDGRLLFVWRRANCDSIIFIHDFHGNWLCEEKIQNSNVSIFVNAGKWLQIWKFYVKTHIDVHCTDCLSQEQNVIRVHVKLLKYFRVLQRNYVTLSPITIQTSMANVSIIPSATFWNYILWQFLVSIRIYVMKWIGN